MALTLEQKRRAKELFKIVGDDEEKKDIYKLDALEIFEELDRKHGEKYQKLEQQLSAILDSFGNYQKAVNKHHQATIESFGSFSEMLSKKLEETGGKITTSYEKNKPFNAAGVYKDMINEIANVSKTVEKNKPVWNWPQYASVGVRNTSFKNINPAVDVFNIGSADDIKLSYTGSNLTQVDYYLNTVKTATLVLSYSGSNLIEVQRTL